MGRQSDAKERLIEAGINLLWLHGYAAVSVDDLCSAANVKKGSFYHFFEGKQELALACLETHWARRRPVLDDAFSPTRSPLQRLHRYLDNVCAWQRGLQRDNGRVLGCFYFSLGVGAADTPRIAERVQQIVATYERYYTSMVRDAQSEGLIDVRCPEEKARALFVFIKGIVMDARVRNNIDFTHNLHTLVAEFLGLRDATALAS
jgi:TetR/AcrR family transcriptional regulator, transcriptional repressor for nem operon